MTNEDQLFRLWAKSDAAGRAHSLPGHLLDSAATAELIWDRFLSEATRAQFDAALQGQGRSYFVLLAAWHDLGKASPSFQLQDAHLATQAAAAGWPLKGAAGDVHHQTVSRVIARRVLLARGLRKAAKWVPAIVQGHHGIFEPTSPVPPPASSGTFSPWPQGQDDLANWVLDQAGISELRDAAGAPSVSLQLAIAGLVSMADWIASSSWFPGTEDRVTDMDLARRRAERAWKGLALQPGWTRDGSVEPMDFARRFGFAPRPLQQEVLTAAENMPEPGLIVVEAPMGEGKTEAALAAVEAIAGRFGFSGFVFAMPTQGTTDAMFERVTAWSAEVDPDLPVALLHGKAMIN